MSKLETVVLVDPACVWERNRCIKTEFFTVAGPDRAVKVILANIHELERFPSRSAWSRVDPQGKMRVVLHDVPCEYGDDTVPIAVCREHLKTAALDGTVWDWDGHLP